ncbi:hypothetical protein COU77_01335 [Candidatus Peregrinibacteria bacterium CG10_big_fil_rev_8_21_14_0_10_49_16]|nr:MAG: hypothetical protein COW95_01265 [Candidatus Peregrinibacteria bacterium CG22_combo_CG10-13_8_21_14_all_49_11]PIR52253.1 MAG: hypothetical protein COU77_01335 [Candidatus Peregrinibacteria bacterium CG10_big_fil_rev_8_21_14_0_10_49_16]
MRELPDKFLTAVIAVQPLPGSPDYDGDDENIVDHALSDLKHYDDAGVDSVFLENDYDLPFVREEDLDHKGIALMTRIAKEVRRRFAKPIGIQMLEAANLTSLRIAREADLDFIRAEGYVYAHIGGAGLFHGNAGKIMRLRKELGAQHIKVFADVKKKHAAHALTADLDITDEIKQTVMFKADGVIVTSKFTGLSPDQNDLRKAKKVTKKPVVIGSGMTKENIQDFLPLADGFIVGSTFRTNGSFLADLDPERLQEFMDVFLKARKKVENVLA